MGQLSLSVGWENGPEQGLKTVSFNSELPVILAIKCTLIRRRVLPRLISVCAVCQCPSPGFTDNPLRTAI